MSLADAHAADRNERLQEAADAYERVLAGDPHDLATTIDLAVLYWQATDFGMVAGLNLPDAFVDRAGRRLDELVRGAVARSGDRPEVMFWAKYIAWAEYGEPFDPDECRVLLREYPEYLEPAMFLYSSSEGVEAEAEALRLLEHCAETRTTRCRYVASVIDSALKSKRFAAMVKAKRRARQQRRSESAAQ
jgi:hypothetical protein